MPNGFGLKARERACGKARLKIFVDRQNLDGNIDKLSICAALAQLDRASDYESEGRGFESLMPHQETLIPRDKHRGVLFFQP